MRHSPWRRAAQAAVLATLLASCRCPEPSGDLADPSPGAQAEVALALHDLLEAAERKDFARLESMHLYGPKFSRYDGQDAGRLDAEATRRAERAGIEPLDSFHAGVEDLKVDVFDRTAIATFVMPYEASAKGQTTTSKVRATLVWVKTAGGWKVAHEHLSPFPAKP